MIAQRKSPPDAGLLTRQVETFYRVNVFVSAIHDLEQLLSLIMQEAEAAVEAEASCIALLNPADNRLYIQFASGEKSRQVQYQSLAMGQGILGEVAATNSIARVDHTQQDPRFDPSFDQKSGFTTRCVLAVPIRRRDELLGVLEVINKRDGRSFTDDDALLLEVVASQAAIAIENARLFARTLQAERLSAVGSMAAAMVHDLKGSMAVINGFAELLGRPESRAEKRAEYASHILRQVDLLVGMTQEVLDYSRGSISLHLETVTVADWLAEITEFLQKDLDRVGVRLVTDLAYRGPAVMDSGRMRRAVINLFNNARDAMPGGGTFTIATRGDGRDWTLTLQDTGSGIPPELRSKIFEPFVTFGKKHGTGLGLSIVRQVVEAHGGSIQVQTSVPGEPGSPSPGTTFTISLPTAPSPGPQPPG